VVRLQPLRFPAIWRRGCGKRAIDFDLKTKDASRTGTGNFLKRPGRHGGRIWRVVSGRARRRQPGGAELLAKDVRPGLTRLFANSREIGTQWNESGKGSSTRSGWMRPAIGCNYKTPRRFQDAFFISADDERQLRRRATARWGVGVGAMAGKARDRKPFGPSSMVKREGRHRRRRTRPASCFKC